ncbi:MAG: DUF1844 domain-containing protein [Verrucomicrobiota bacterium]|jgi:hypothetical protein
MSNPQQPQNSPADSGRTEELSALFAHLVIQQSNMAMMLLGKTAHPETGRVVRDIEAARLFIDQLEMLEVKTRGNLSKEEAGLLKQGLVNLRLAFVEAVESAPAPSSPQTSAQTPPAQAPAPSPAPEEESRKKFSKKY